MGKMMVTLLVALMLLSGCGSSLEGTYDHPKKGDIVLELKANGNFKMDWEYEHALDIDGTWKIMGNSLLLFAEPPMKGDPAIFTIRGVNIEDQNGVWLKR
jgi:uncharacterized protein YceK